MSKSSIFILGANLTRKSGEIPPKRSTDEIFTKSKFGIAGGSAKRAAEEKSKAENDQVFEDHYKSLEQVKDPEPPPKTVVTLSNPAWSEPRAEFGQKIRISVEGSLPPGIEHRTKVSFTVYATASNAERERIGSLDAHLKSGVAEAEIELWPPNTKTPEGQPLEECPYIFVAKHSCSEDLTSEPLPVSRKKFALNDLKGILETLENEKGVDAVRVLVRSMNYKAICELSGQGGTDNDPNKMPSRFFLLPGSDDSKREITDAHPDDSSHEISVANLRLGLIRLGYDYTPEGSFDSALMESLNDFLGTLQVPCKNGTTLHTVAKGETLGGIALQYHLPSWRILFSCNKTVIGNNPDMIRAGTRLNIPAPINARAEQLIRNKGGDPGTLMGGTPYAYTWVPLSFCLGDTSGGCIHIEKETPFALVHADTGETVHSGNISGKGSVSILVPNGTNFDLRIEGFGLQEKEAI